ncbi:MAG: B12-binding domain-containing protein [Promethearchaeota archaeon]
MTTKEEVIEKLIESLATNDEDPSLQAVQEALNLGMQPYEIVNSGITKGLQIVGKKFEDKDYFLPDLLMAADIVKKIMGILDPLLKAGEGSYVGKVVIGTVESDIHDIGKNIVIALLQSGGFETYDLGVDVTTQKFVEKVKEVKPNILAMSALLTTTMENMRDVIDALKKEGLRNDLKVIIGGACITEDFVKEIGADARGTDAIEALEICKQWI